MTTARRFARPVIVVSVSLVALLAVAGWFRLRESEPMDDMRQQADVVALPKDFELVIESTRRVQPAGLDLSRNSTASTMLPGRPCATRFVTLALGWVNPPGSRQSAGRMRIRCAIAAPG